MKMNKNKRHKKKLEKKCEDKRKSTCVWLVVHSIRIERHIKKNAWSDHAKCGPFVQVENE